MKLFVYIFVFLTSPVVYADEIQLAESVIQNGQPFTEIMIPTCRTLGKRLTAWKLGFLRNGARLNHVAVFYTNGQAEAVYFRKTLEAGEETSWVFLSNTYLCPRRLRIFGSSLQFTPRAALVRVVGDFLVP